MTSVKILQQLPQLFRYADVEKYTGNANVFLTRAGFNLVLPEKALLDTIYLRKAIPFRDELNLDILDRRRLDLMADLYPVQTRKLAHELLFWVLATHISLTEFQANLYNSLTNQKYYGLLKPLFQQPHQNTHAFFLTHYIYILFCS